MTTIPQNYTPALGLYDTQKAIGLIKNIFQVKLCAALHLKRVTAPLFVDPATGLNDDLNGVERPVGFDIPAVGKTGQVVHSLAKWKRLALHDYDFFVGNGLITDMNAIRRDEELDNLHSIYVDQWDWEKVIDRESRTEAYLQDAVRKIVTAICGTLDELQWQFQDLPTSCAGRWPLSPPRSWRTAGRTVPPRSGRTCLSRSIPPRLFSGSAAG